MFNFGMHMSKLFRKWSKHPEPGWKKCFMSCYRKIGNYSFECDFEVNRNKQVEHNKFS